MEKLAETVTQAFHREVRELKPFLPKGYKQLLIQKLPKSYDNYGGGVRIQNVIIGRVADPLVLAALKEIVSEQTLKSA